MGNYKDFAIAQPNIKLFFTFDQHSVLLSRNRMYGANSDNISVLANTMACLGGLDETTNVTMDSDTVDGILIFV